MKMNPIPIGPDLASYFWQRVAVIPPDDCWYWVGPEQNAGYGCAAFQGVRYLAHRVSWALHNGPIPEGMSMDHLCRNRKCVNPSHLEAVAQRINVQRGVLGQPHEFCKRGHDLAVHGVMRRDGRGRYCHTCHLERCRNNGASQRFRAKERQAMSLRLMASRDPAGLGD